MITLRVAGFDWDSANRAKCQKHGVPPSEIEALFRSDPLIAPDPKHSLEEDRMIAVGRTSDGKPIFVAFTLREKDGQRFIRQLPRGTCTPRRSKVLKKKVPKLRTDRAAEKFLAQDLSRLDFSQFKPARFEFQKKDEQINMRVPGPLLAALKAEAKARGIPYTRFIRETLERAIFTPDS